MRYLPVLASFVVGRIVTCESCHEEFSCGVSLTGCWCNEIKLSEQTRTALREQFTDCLCRTCLERLAATEYEG
jgi:hypothetical protein